VEIHGVNWIEMLHVGLSTDLRKFRDGYSGCQAAETVEEGLWSLSGKRL